MTKIRRIKTALREASQFYVQLHVMGFNVEFVDIGGGLGVDYDGTRSANSESSVNYSIHDEPNPEFACSVVRGIDSAVNSVTGAKEYPDAVHLRKVPLRKKKDVFQKWLCHGHARYNSLWRGRCLR